MTDNPQPYLVKEEKDYVVLCLMQRYLPMYIRGMRSDIVSYYRAWIPEIYAKKNKNIKIEVNGEWIEFLVVEPRSPRELYSKASLGKRDCYKQEQVMNVKKKRKCTTR